MKIVLVTGEFPVLSQTFIASKAIGLARAGLQVRVMALARGDAAYHHSLLGDMPKNLAVQYLPARDHAAAAFARLPAMIAAAIQRSPGDTRRLFRIVRSRHGRGRRELIRLYRLLPYVGMRPDVIHFEFAGKAVELIELLELLPCAKVVSCRGTDIRIQPLGNPRQVENLRHVFSRVDLVHCVSWDTLQQATRYGLDASRAFVNHPSIDTAYFAPVVATRREISPPVVLSVGRLDWKKGYDYALQAMRRLRDHGFAFRYRIVGSGPAEDSIRYAIWELGLEDVVELLGPEPRERVREQLGEADVFLLSSLTEGLSNAVLEAMSMRLPVVTTSAGGMGEAVREGMDGFVVPTRAPEVMAERLARLLVDPALRRRLGESGRERVLDGFTIERQTECFIECYRSLCSGNRALDGAAGER